MPSETKNELLEQLLKEPLAFERSDGVEALTAYGMDHEDVRALVKRVYDVNERQLLEVSNANSGKLGFLNRYSTRKRHKRYGRRVDSQDLGNGGLAYVRIYAEGDSWFQFPVFITDIIDWLNKSKRYLIYSEAFGGDWITNIIYEGQYIPSLSIHSPHYFLVSGGGNDLVGNSRLAMMVEKEANYSKYNRISDIEPSILTDAQKEMVLKAQPYIRKEFYAFLNIVKLQYTLLFTRLYSETSKHRHIITLTQGYDYPFPRKGVNFSCRYPMQPLLNWMLGSGKWLYRPLMIKGIHDSHIQQAILMTLIYEFNETMSSFARGARFPKVYHMDCRGIATDQKKWYDELHLKGNYFRKVACVFKQVIEEPHSFTDRVVRVVDHLDKIRNCRRYLKHGIPD